jgi:hypothetical protein
LQGKNMSNYSAEETKRLEILQKVVNKELSIEEASKILEAIDRKIEEETSDRQEETSKRSSPVEGEIFSSKFSSSMTSPLWWIIPFSIFVLITLLGATWLYNGWQAAHFGVGFWLAWIPFALGILGMALSWGARISRWVKIRIHQKKGSKKPAITILGRQQEMITFSFPLPTRLIKWVTRYFGSFYPADIRGLDLDEFMDALETSVSDESPLYAWIDEDKEGNQVEIWIGGR